MKSILIIFGLVIVVLLSSCNNPDFAKYRFYEKNVQFQIEGNLFVISDIEDEMLKIAESYCKEITLSKVEYTFSDETTGTLYFYYISINDDRTTNVMLEIDIAKKAVRKVTFEVGHSKRVTSSGKFVDHTNHDARDILKVTISDLEKKGYNPEEISHISIKFIDKYVRVNSFDIWNRPINGYYYPL